MTARATGADAAAQSTITFLKVRDPNDNIAPAAQLDRTLADQPLTALTNFSGLVQDGNLDEWQLEMAPIGSSAFVTLGRGTTNRNNDSLAAFDPALYANGFYVLRLTATDISGRSTRSELIVENAGATKAAQYLRPESDLSVDWGGQKVSLVRVYNSLERDRGGSFGYGWRFSPGEFFLESNVAATGQEAAGVFNPFAAGTRVVLTLPDNRQAGFTFRPDRQISGGITYYNPHWVADAGTNYSLESAPTKLIQFNGRFFELNSGRPYNPASGFFTGPAYTLTAPDQTRYELNGAGELEALVTRAGTRIVSTRAGLTNLATGETVRFIRDASGRIQAVVAPDGSEFQYTFDAAGNLVTARNSLTGQTVRYGYLAADPHLLTAAVASTAQGSEAVTTSPALSVQPLLADLGSLAQLRATPVSGTLRPGATDRYAFSVRPSELEANISKRLLIGISIEASGASAIQPDAPQLFGADPLISSRGNGTAFSLFAIDAAGLQIVALRGATAATSGDYTVKVFVAGDVNADGLVDGADSKTVLQKLGAKTGEPNYSGAADINRDGAITEADLQILGSNFGNVANRPPAIVSTSARTHRDLDRIFALADVANDPENDPVFVRASNVKNGTVRLTPDGLSLVFTPAAGFSGTASFELVADDGFGSSAPATISVTVSGSPLLSLDFKDRHPVVPVGQSAQLVVLGTFADEPNVALAFSYLSFLSTNPAAAVIAPTGKFTARSAGYGAFVVSSHGIQAATAFLAGGVSTSDESDLALKGITVTPAMLKLKPAGQQQLAVRLPDQTEVTRQADGTAYYPSNAQIANVDGNGVLIAGPAAGSTTVTVIHKMAEFILPVIVENPVPGPATLGAGGGIVEGANGSSIALPDGALTSPAKVALTLIAKADLALPLPAPFLFAAAFRLELGAGALAERAQLSIPVAAGIPAGTRVFFMRAGTIPDETGKLQDAWFQTEMGVVGADGLARTSSILPTNGITQSGEYWVAYAPAGTIGFAELDLKLAHDLSPATAGFIADVKLPLPDQGLQSRGSGKHQGTTFRKEIRMAIQVPTIAQALAGTIVASTAFGAISPIASVAAPALFSFAFLPLVLAFPEGIPIITITEVAQAYLTTLPKTTQLGVKVNADRVSKFETIVENAPTPKDFPSDAPVIDKVEFEFHDFEGRLRPSVKLTGKHFFVDAPAGAVGSQLRDITVLFVSPGGSREVTAPGGPRGSDRLDTNTPGTIIWAVIPQEVPVGLSEIVIQRHQQRIFDTPTRRVSDEHVFSKPVTLTPRGQYVFTALQSSQEADMGVAVFDGESPPGHPGAALLAKIPIKVLPSFSSLRPQPSSVSVSRDATRGYLPLRNIPAVAIFDPIALQQIDANPQNDEGTIDIIPLPPDARPVWSVIDRNDQYLYVTDERPDAQGNGRIYVIDINPQSETYNQALYPTIVAGPAPLGLRQLDINASNTWLFVAAPGQELNRPTPGGQQPGHVLVIDTNPLHKDKFHTQIDTIEAGKGTFGIKATDNPRKFFFTDRRFDPTGFGVAVFGNPTDGELRLISPIDGEEINDLNPELQWDTGSLAVTKATLYVSIYDAGHGLYPDDRPENLSEDYLADKNGVKDINPTRILTLDVTGKNSSTISPSDQVHLTRGQTYYWAIEVVTKDNLVVRQSTSFKVKAKEGGGAFSSVVLITHGFQIPYLEEGQAPKDFIELGQLISKAGGGDGTVLVYDPPTGEWRNSTSGALTLPAAGKPLVLVSNWSHDSTISDSGFAEAAADALFAGLVKLDQDHGGNIFGSPMHLIGFSRGTPVTSEIAQRIGTYFPQKKDVQMTTLDPHDFPQPSLDVPLSLVTKTAEALASLLEETPLAPLAAPLEWLFKAATKALEVLKIETVPYSDFKDPSVTAWKTLQFYDNYWQSVANPAAVSFGNALISGLTTGTIHSFTPNGRPVPGADINLDLNGRPGFTRDDYVIGVGTAHQRVKWWYAGTIDLAAERFPAKDGDAFFRLPAHADKEWNKGFNGSPTPPWYTAAESEAAGYKAGDPNAPAEGVGEGWFYSVLGGGDDRRPAATDPQNKKPVEFDNTAYGHPDLPVPTIFNGNFDSSIRPLERFPIAHFNIPGWSFHNRYDNFQSNVPVDVNLDGFYLQQVGTYEDKTPDYALLLGQRPQESFDTLKLDDLDPATRQVVKTIASVALGPLTVLGHNRMYVPAWAHYLRIDTNVEGQSPKDAFHVLLAPPGVNGDSPQAVLAQIDLTHNSAGAFVTHYIDVSKMAGKVAELILEERDMDGNGYVPVLVDNIQFAPVVPTDDDGDSLDSVSMFLEGQDSPLSGEVLPPATLLSGAGLSSTSAALPMNELVLQNTPDASKKGLDHIVTYKNLLPVPVQVQWQVSQNQFLKLIDVDGNPISGGDYNDDRQHTFPSTTAFFPLAPGAEIKLHFRVELSDAYKSIKRNLEIIAMAANLTMTGQVVLPNGENKPLTPERYSFVDVEDNADDDPNDNELKFADTREGLVRTLEIDSQPGLKAEFAATGDPISQSNKSGRFDLIFDKDFTKIEKINYTALAYDNTENVLRVPVNFYFQGRRLSVPPGDKQPLFAAHTTPIQTVNVPSNLIFDEIDWLLKNVAQWDPVNLIPNPDDLTGPLIDAYDRFKAAFGGATSLSLQQKIDISAGITEAFRTLFDGFGSDLKLTFNPPGVDTQGPQKIDGLTTAELLRTATSRPPENSYQVVLSPENTKNLVNPGQPGPIADAPLDFAWSTFALLFETPRRTAENGPARVIDPTISQRSKLFILSKLTNSHRDIGFEGGVIHLYLGDIARAQAGLTTESPATPTSARTFGKVIGLILAHEVGHTLGLQDEYFVPGRSNLMGSPINPTLTAIQHNLLSLGLDDPDVDDLLKKNVNSLINDLETVENANYWQFRRPQAQRETPPKEDYKFHARDVAAGPIPAPNAIQPGLGGGNDGNTRDVLQVRPGGSVEHPVDVPVAPLIEMPNKEVHSLRPAKEQPVGSPTTPEKWNVSYVNLTIGSVEPEGDAYDVNNATGLVYIKLHKLADPTVPAGKDLAAQIRKDQLSPAAQTAQGMADKLRTADLPDKDLKQIVDDIARALPPAKSDSKLYENLLNASQHLAKDDKAGAALALVSAKDRLNDLLAESEFNLPTSAGPPEKVQSIAFVAGYNEYIAGLRSHDPNLPNLNGSREIGSNVGIIINPFGKNPRLVAFTKEKYVGFAEGLALSADQKLLFISFRGRDTVSVYSVNDILSVVRTYYDPNGRGLLTTDPIDDLPFTDSFGITRTLDVKNLDIQAIPAGSAAQEVLAPRKLFLPDLKVKPGSLKAPKSSFGQTTPVSYTVEGANLALIPPKTRWFEEIYLTDDGLVDQKGVEILLDRNAYDGPGTRERNVFVPQISQKLTRTSFTIDSVAAGLYFTVKVDGDNNVFEKYEQNNQLDQLAEWNLPELVAEKIKTPIVVFGAKLDDLTFSVKNTGHAAVPPAAQWNLQVWLGTDQEVWKPSDSTHWHYKVASSGSGLPPGQALPAGGEMQIRFKADLTKVTAPPGIDRLSLKWIILVDWPEGADSAQARPGGVLEESEVNNNRDPNANVYQATPPQAPVEGGKSRSSLQNGGVPKPMVEQRLERVTRSQTQTAGSQPGSTDIPNLYVDDAFQQDLDPLRIEARGGAQFVWNDSQARFEGTGLFAIGLKPKGTDAFAPLLQLQGSVWFNKLILHADGEAKALVGNISAPLFQGAWEVNVGSATTNFLNEAAQGLAGDYTLAGAALKFAGMSFVPPAENTAAGARVEFRGSMTLPPALGSLQFEITGGDYIALSKDGISLHAATLQAPDAKLDIGGFQLNTNQVTLRYENTGGGTLKLGGIFRAPQLGTTVRLLLDEGQYFQLQKDTQENAVISFVGTISTDLLTINATWSLRDITLNLKREASDWKVDGEAIIAGPDARLAAKLRITPTSGVELTVTSEPGEDFKLFGLGVDVAKLVFKSDRLPGVGEDWDPELRFSGTLTLPVALTGPVVKITPQAGAGSLKFDLPDDKPLVINAAGFSLPAGSLSAPGKWQLELLNIVTVDIVNPILIFNTEARWAELRLKIIFPQLNQAEVDLAGSNYLKLSDQGLEVVGKLSIKDPINITKDGKWRFEKVMLEVNTVKPAYQGSLSLVTPDAQLDAEITIDPAAITIKAKTSGGSFSLLGLKFQLLSLLFVSDRAQNRAGPPVWDPELTLQGILRLPDSLGGLELDVSGDNKIVVNEEGISVSGGTLSLPGKRKFKILNLLEVETRDASVQLDFKNGEVTLKGSYSVPSFHDLTIDLTGPNFLTLRQGSSGLEVEANIHAAIADIPVYGAWSIRDVKLNFVKNFQGSGAVDASGRLNLPGGKQLGLAFKFSQGKLDEFSVSTDAEPDFEFLGAQIDIRTLRFRPDRHAGDDQDWDPLFVFQGKLILPALLGGLEVAVEDLNTLTLSADGVDLTGAALAIPKVELNFFNLIRVSADALSLEYVKSPFMLKIQGRISLPQVFGITADFAGPNFVRITEKPGGGSQVDLVGEISADKISFIPGVFELSDLKIKLDTVKNQLSGAGTVTIPPGMDISAEVGFLNGRLNEIKLAIDPLRPPTGLPIAQTGAFLQKITGLLNHIAPDDPSPVEFGGGVGVTAGPQLVVPLPSWAGGNFKGSLIRLDVLGTIDRTHLTATGQVDLIGGLVRGNGNAELNWSQGFLKAGATFTVLGGLETLTASFTADSNFNLTMRGQASVTLPNIRFTPLSGQMLGAANGYFQFRNNATSQDDFAAGWGQLNVPLFGPITLGVQVSFDGNYRVISSEAEIPPAARGSASLAQENRRFSVPDSASQTFNVPAGAQRLMLMAMWENGDAPGEVQVQAPDGTIYSEAAMAQQTNMQILDAFTAPGKKTVGVLKPAAGIWKISLVKAAALGETRFAAYRDSFAPAVSITSVSQIAGGIVDLHYSASDPDSQSRVAIYYDTDNSGYDGVLVTEGLIEADGANSFQWKPGALPPGTYSFYAVIQDENNPPVFSPYFAQPITLADPVLVNLSGQTFNDANGDGIKNLGENPLPGVTVFLDANHNQKADADESKAASDSSGHYQFVVARGNFYTLQALAPAGSQLTTGAQTVFADGDRSGIDFGRVVLGRIAGMVFNDLNGDSLAETAEPGLAGVILFLDENRNGLLDPGEDRSETDAAGRYSFANLLPGHYQITELNTGAGQGAGLVANFQQVEIAGGTSADNRDFALVLPATIQGRVFRDLDLDGLAAISEPGVPDVTLFLDTNGNGLPDRAEPATVTDSSGAYRFSQLGLGSYSIVSQMPAGLISTLPNESASRTAVVTQSGSLIEGEDFGTRGPGLLNGDFTTNNPASLQTGWQIRGSAEITNGQAVLGEHDRLSGRIYQSFVIPENAVALQFTLVRATFGDDPSNPPDAFEAALLNAATLTPLAGAAVDLAGTDSQFNLQRSGQVYFGAQTKVSGAAKPGDTVLLTGPVIVEISLRNIAPGTRAVLYFDLLGFGADNSSVAIDDVRIVRESAPEVSGLFVFYNHSAFDGNDPAATAQDDAAIAPDKSALLPGNVPAFANYTSYSRGLNGLIIDLSNPPGTPTLNDFTFKMGNNNDPASWTAAPKPSGFLVRPGAGVGGSTRVTITWADQAIAKEWLQVRIAASAATGLAAPDVFYFGNAPGESGNAATDAKVNATDEIAVRNSPSFGAAGLVPISDPADYNRDGHVDGADEVVARNNGTTFATALRLFPFRIAVILSQNANLPGETKPVEPAGTDRAIVRTAIEVFSRPAIGSASPRKGPRVLPAFSSNGSVGPETGIAP